MLDSAIAGRIKDAVDAGFDEQVDFTAELVKFPSRRGREHTAQDFMAKAMREQGLGVDRWQIDVDQISHLPGFPRSMPATTMSSTWSAAIAAKPPRANR